MIWNLNMAVLSSKIQEQIDRLEELAYEKFENGEIEESLKLSEQAWKLYPEPKNNWNEAYNSAKYIADYYMKLNNYDKVKEWVNQMIYINNNLHQSDDELCFYIGKYKFEIKDFEGALEEFKFVVKESQYRHFEDEDSKYLDFYLTHK